MKLHSAWHRLSEYNYRYRFYSTYLNLNFCKVITLLNVFVLICTRAFSHVRDWLTVKHSYDLDVK